MHMELLLLGIASFMSVSDQTDVSNKCYRAKICIHNGKEKCGRNEKGKVRRFLDSCDMKEYNCLRNTAYVKTFAAKCQDLPLIKNKMLLHKDNDIKDDNGNEKQFNDDMSEPEVQNDASKEVKASEMDEIDKPDGLDQESKANGLDKVTETKESKSVNKEDEAELNDTENEPEEEEEEM